jgi:hypothetical protein
VGWGRSGQLLRLWGRCTSCVVGVSSRSLEIAEAQAGLTSDELEGLGHHLVAIVVSVLVVGHGCGGVSGVLGGGGAAMAGGRGS